MKTIQIVLLGLSLLTIGCSNTKQPFWQPEPALPSGKPDVNIIQITSFIERIIPICYGQSNLPEESINLVVSPEAYSKMIIFKNQYESHFNGRFDELVARNYDIAKQHNSKNYIAQIQMISNIRENIILSNFLYIIELTGNNQAPYRVIDFREQTFLDVVR